MTQNKTKRFLMIDGSSLLFRAFYAIRNLTTRDGIFTNGVYGFLTMYLNAVEKVHPDYIVVAFDRGGKTFRTEDYEAYKGNRQETPSELAAQFGMTKDVLSAMGIKVLDQEGFEADDIVGTIAKQASKSGIQSFLLTGDRDYFQLVDANTSVLYTKKGISELEEVDEAWIQEKYGLAPKDLIEVKGLQGDASDNIPGVSGIGEKTALKLIREFGSIDAIYENLDAISGKKLRQNLEEGRASAFMSRKIGTIYREVPLEETLEDFIPSPVDAQKLEDRFERLEFQSLREKFFPRSAPVTLASPVASPGEEEWPELAKTMREQKMLVVGLFADEERYTTSMPAYCVIRDEEKRAYVFSLQGREDAFKDAFLPLFTSKQGPRFLGYDWKESMVLLSHLGIDFTGAYEDVMLMEYLQDSNRVNDDPAGMSDRLLHQPMPRREELLGKGKKRTTFTSLPEEKRNAYFSQWVHAVAESAPILRESLEKMGAWKLYETIENPLVRVLARMEEIGVAVDPKVLDRLEAEFSGQMQTLESRIYEEAGEVFNIQSPKQLGEVLFEKLSLPHGKKTKTGYSTSAEVLEKLQDVHPIVDDVLNYRRLSKLVSTYIDGFRPYIGRDGRVRSVFRQNVAATGRISSTEPNLQNIPVRTEEGRQLRAVFVAPEGRKLVDSDYSQIELRILASLSGDETMQESFRKGEDIHRKTAAEVNHISLDEVTQTQRSYAKAVNFGIIYGISDFGLSRDLGISRAEAKEYIESYKDTYPGIRAYMQGVVDQAKTDGYVDTYYGRRREIPELKSRNFNLRNFGERVALNTPIQGTAADVIKQAMIRVDRALQDGGWKARLVLQIHDELIIEAPEEEAEEVGKLVVREMENIGDFPVPLTADMKIGNNWFETK